METTPTTPAPSNTYTVKQGDTLNGIAKNLGYSNYKDAGFSLPKSGSYDLIMPGETLNHNGQNNQMIVTSTPARKETATASSALDIALKNAGVNGQGQTQTDGDPMLAMLDKMGTTYDSSTNAMINSIRAAKQNNANSINTQYDNYKRGLQLLGVQSGMSEATPDILLSHVNEAENQHRQKLQALDGEEAKAIMEAETARSEKNFALFKEKMDYVDKIKKEKQNSLKDLYDNLTASKGIGDLKAHEIYSELQKLGTADKEKYLQEIAKQFQIPVSTLVQAVADEAIARQKAATKKKSGGGSGSSGFTWGKPSSADIRDVESYMQSIGANAAAYALIRSDKNAYYKVYNLAKKKKTSSSGRSSTIN